jgi:hypothetical protein
MQMSFGVRLDCVYVTRKSDVTVDVPAASGLELVATLCGGGHCPTVYRTNRGTLVVQGYAVTAEMAGVDLSPGELLVEIPAGLLHAARDAGA